jgi:hypothetical protein
MLSFSHEALPEGCDRARDPFLLGRLKAPAAGADTFAARARSARCPATSSTFPSSVNEPSRVATGDVGRVPWAPATPPRCPPWC